MNIQELLNLKKSITTYNVGLLQAKVYRKLKDLTNEALKPYDISSVEWAFLGVIFDHSTGIRSTELAKKLGVKAPFITELVPKFEQRKLLKYEKDDSDARVKKIILTTDGKKLVSEIEKVLRAESKKWLDGLSFKDVYTYLKVLRKISKI